MTTFSLMLKIYDWLRLFDSLSFYLKLIGWTIYEATPLLTFCFIALPMFGLPMIMLNFYTLSDDQEDIVGSGIRQAIAATINDQYQNTIGNYYVSGFEDHHRNGLVYIFFILSTAFSQILMLNMLIAVMGDTFDQVTEQK